MYARCDDLIYVHGSPGSRMLRVTGSGVPVCLTVTLLDGLVLARSVFHHSMNYRSVVVTGRAALVSDAEEKMVAFKALVDHVLPSRWQDARPPNRKELASTKVLRLPLSSAAAKLRRGGPVDAEADLQLRTWAGEIPLETRAGPPLDSADLAPGIAPPQYARRYRRPG